MYLPISCFCIRVYVTLICVIIHVILRHKRKTDWCLNKPKHLFSVLHLTILVVFQTVSLFHCFLVLLLPFLKAEPPALQHQPDQV